MRAKLAIALGTLTTGLALGLLLLVLHVADWKLPVIAIGCVGCVSAMCVGNELPPSDYVFGKVTPTTPWPDPSKETAAKPPAAATVQERILKQDPNKLKGSGIDDSKLIDPDQYKIFDFVNEEKKTTFLVHVHITTSACIIETPCIVVVKGKDIFLATEKEDLERPNAMLARWENRRTILVNMLGLSKTNN